MLPKILKRPSSSIKPLDGIRAIAILLVLCIHSKEILVMVSGRESFLMSIPPFKGGWVGIPLFFNLSGFLIGLQVWKELTETGTIKFWHFFLKRAFRIWPLFYTLFIVFVLFPYRQNVTDYWINAFFLSNFLGDNGPVMASWSLATEEQFYLFLPLILKIASFYSRSKGHALSLKTIRKALILCFFLPLISRILTWDYILKMDSFNLSVYMKYIYRPIVNHSEGLLAGLFLATYFVDEKLPKVDQKKAIILLGFTALLGLVSFKSKVYFNFMGVAISAATLLWFSMSYDTILSRSLSHPALALIAKCSFSMYLINWPVLYILKNLGLLQLLNLPLDMQLLFNTLLLTLICIAVSVINFYIIENPALELRRKLIRS